MTVVAEPEQSDNAVIAVPRRSDRNQNPPRSIATGAARGWLRHGQQLWRGAGRARSGRAAPRELGRCQPTRHTARQRAQAAGQPITCAPHTEMPDLRTTEVVSRSPTTALRKTHAHRACWKFRMRWCATLMPACAKDSAENFSFGTLRQCAWLASTTATTLGTGPTSTKSGQEPEAGMEPDVSSPGGRYT